MNPVLRLFIPLALLMPTYNVFGQCNTNIPDSTSYIGKTTLNTEHLSQSIVQISKTGENTYLISDFTCGFIKQFDNVSEFSVNLEFNCNQILPTSIESEYGPISITGGSWEASNNALTIHWNNEINDITETSIFHAE